MADRFPCSPSPTRPSRRLENSGPRGKGNDGFLEEFDISYSSECREQKSSRSSAHGNLRIKIGRLFAPKVCNNEGSRWADSGPCKNGPAPYLILKVYTGGLAGTLRGEAGEKVFARGELASITLYSLPRRN